MEAIWDATREATRNATREAIRNATREAIRGATAARDATWNATMAATWDATMEATDAPTRNATMEAIRDATWNATWNVTMAAARDAAGATMDATMDATMEAKVAAVIADIVSAYGIDLNAAKNAIRGLARVNQGGNMWAQHDAYLTAARDILGLRLDPHEHYAAREQAAIHGGYRYMHRKFCMVSDFPEVLKTDEEGLPHSEDGPSHRWRDGWEIYCWHGTRVPARWIAGGLSAEEALDQDNTELRRAACEIVGWDRVLESLSPTVLDVDQNPQIGELVEVEIDGRKERFVKVECGTGRTFALPVPPTVLTALEAVAWTYGMEPEEYKPEVRT